MSWRITGQVLDPATGESVNGVITALLDRVPARTSTGGVVDRKATSIPVVEGEIIDTPLHSVPGARWTFVLPLGQRSVSMVDPGDGASIDIGGDLPVGTPVPESEAILLRREWQGLRDETAASVDSMAATAASVRSSEAAAKAAAAQAVAPTDTQVATLAGQSTSQTRAALDARWVVRPSAAEQIVHVSPRGSDSLDGLAVTTAKRTLSAAIAALGGKPGVIQVGSGTLTTNETHVIPSGVTIRGVGRQLGASMINYTGTGTLFTGTSGTRTYNFKVQDVLFNGPGKTSSAVAIDLVDVSNARFDSCTFGAFGTAFKHRSVVIGGAVYNSFLDIVINSCGTGVDFGLNGSNGSRWWGVKFGSCTTAVNIVDSNQNNWHACQFEGNTTAIAIDATLAGLSDHNSFSNCRFEGNATPWNIKSAAVRDTEILWPAVFGTWTAGVDNGSRTVIQASVPPFLPPPGVVRPVTTRSGNYTLTPADDIVIFTAGSVAVTATLPDPASVPAGRTYTIKQRGTVPLTVTAAAGTTEVTSIAAGSSVRVVASGGQWWGI